MEKTKYYPLTPIERDHILDALDVADRMFKILKKNSSLSEEDMIKFERNTKIMAKLKNGGISL